MGTPHKVTAFGRTLTVTEWSRELAIPAQTLFKRLEKGWPPERALSTPNRTITNVTKTYRAEWYIWKNLRRRCLNPKRKEYPRYGGRGIMICERWAVFANFISDVGPRPTPAHSIERRDNDGHYEPANCYWATDQEQRWNKSTTLRITHDGVTLNVAEWAAKTGLPPKIIRSRYRGYGWSADKTFTTPLRPRGKYERKPSKL